MVLTTASTPTVLTIVSISLFVLLLAITEQWGARMVICLEQDADFARAGMSPLPGGS